MIRYILIFITLFSLLACTDNNDSMHAQEGAQDVILNIQLPQTYATRAQTANEAFVNDIMVLVFRNGKFQYHAPGISIQNNTDEFTSTFRVRLVATLYQTELLLLANATNEVIEAALIPGTTKEAVKEKITALFTSQGLTGNFPMFASCKLPNIPKEGTVVNNIRLLRAIARIDIDASPVQGQFKLKTIQAYKATERIQIIPNQVEANNLVSTPSIPVTGQNNVNTEQLTTTSEQLSEKQLYLPESASVDPDNWLNATCIVIGGVFGEDNKTTYYRINFTKADGTYPFGQILRNHRYRFTIQNIESSGWETPGQAAENKESGMSIVVEDWNEEDLYSYFDGSHHLIVSPGTVKLKYREGASATFKIDTDIDNYTVEWVSGAELFSHTLSADRTEIIVRSKQENLGFNNITGKIKITAGRFSAVLNVVQRPGGENLKSTIQVMCINSIGSLGRGSLGDVKRVGNLEAMPMRYLLNAHFKPDGTVRLGNIIFDYLGGTTGINDITDDQLTETDILFLNYNCRPTVATANKILEWLEGSENRVLMLSYEWKASRNGASRTNWELLQLLKTDIIPYWYNGSAPSEEHPYDLSGSRSDFRAPFYVHDAARYFFKDGPFTTTTSGHPEYTPVTSCYFWVEDNYWGKALHPNPNIIPLVRFVDLINDNNDSPWRYNDEGNADMMILGVDPKKRIVYIGDSEMFTRAGVGSNEYKNAGRLYDDDGTIGNDYSRIMANLWAWMIEEVVLAN